MRDSSAAVNDLALRARLAAEPASVPVARRFVADWLRSWGRTALVHDAQLCVSELAANAALHTASTSMEIGLHVMADTVRISVEDDGATTADEVVPRPDFPGPDTEVGDDVVLAGEATTGRGLAIVSIVAKDWGVEKLENGKRIWADLTEDTRPHRIRQPKTTEVVREGDPPPARSMRDRHSSTDRLPAPAVTPAAFTGQNMIVANTPVCSKPTLA